MKKLLCILAILLLVCGCSTSAPAIQSDVENNTQTQEQASDVYSINDVLIDKDGFKLSLKEISIKDNKLVLTCDYENNYKEDLYLYFTNITINGQTFISKELLVLPDDPEKTYGSLEFYKANSSGIAHSVELDLSKFNLKEVGNISFGMIIGKDPSFISSIKVEESVHTLIEGYTNNISLDSMEKYEYDNTIVYIDKVEYVEADSFASAQVRVTGVVVRNADTDLDIPVILTKNDEQVIPKQGKYCFNIISGNFDFAWNVEESKEELENCELATEWLISDKLYRIVLRKFD